MKYFLIFFLGLIPFFSPAQEVVIPANVARYFLETHDRMKILTKRDSLNRQIISELGDELSIKQNIILTYQADSTIFRSIIFLKEQQDSLLRREILSFQRALNMKTFETNLFAGVAAGAILGSVIPGIGVLPGATLGLIAGAGIYGIKKILVFLHKKKF